MNDLKVHPQIGVAYRGPRFDRPALRQRPRGWVLEESKPQPRRISPDGFVLIAAIAAWAFCVVQTIAGMVR